MTEFVDLKGASGRSYRFRLADPKGLSPVGGNYCFVEAGPDGARPLLLGIASALISADESWPAARKAGATHLYTRLNVARGARRAEHEDIAAALGKAVEAETHHEKG